MRIKNQNGVMDLSYEDVVALFASKLPKDVETVENNVIVVDGDGEDIVITTESSSEAVKLALDIRVAFWSGKLWTQNCYSLPACVPPTGGEIRFLPHNKIVFQGESPEDCVTSGLNGLLWDKRRPTPVPLYRTMFTPNISVKATLRLDQMLVGRTINAVRGLELGSEQVEIDTDEGTIVLWHDQECCEQVSLFDFEGDEEDLVGAKVCAADTNVDDVENTFYSIRTTNGDLWLRFGNGNETAYSIAMKVGFIPRG
jgi:hypothetical protein